MSIGDEGADPDEGNSSSLFVEAVEPLEDLARLRQLFDDLGARCAEGLMGLSLPDMEFISSGLRAGLAIGTISAFDGKRVVGRMSVPDCEQGAFLVADREFLFTMLEMLLGGDGRGGKTMSGRALTTIEKSIAGLLLGVVAKALTDAFCIIAPMEFDLEEVVEGIDYEVLGGEDARVVGASYELKLDGRSGTFEFNIPVAMLEPLRSELAKPVDNDARIIDPNWARQIETEITRSFVRLRAVLDAQQVALGQVANLRPGDMFALKAGPSSLVKVECNGEMVFWSRLGQSGGAYTVQIEEFVAGQGGLTRELLKV